MLRRVKALAVRFHRDEEGMETLQIVMILAIAAMVCMGVTQVGGVSGSGEADSSSGIFGGVGSIISDIIPISF